MSDKIKIIIAEDNIHLCKLIKKFLSEKEEIEILGIANNDEDELRMIEELKPEIVITDLVRDFRYTGLDIIKEYSNKKNSPEFLVISADKEEYIIKDEINIAGYIEKTPFMDYELIFNELKRIKEKMDREQREKN